MSIDISDRKRLVDTALGKVSADLVIKNGLLIDVYSGRLVPNCSIAVSGSKIAYVGPDADYAVGNSTHVIDAKGCMISPGYMDVHTHLSSHWDISDFLKYAIPCGITTLITEIESYGFALGARGVRDFLSQISSRPIKMFGLIPPMVTISPAVKELFVTTDEAVEFLKDDRIIGLGESYWQDVVLKDDTRILELMEKTLEAGKSVQGHAAGAFDRKLASYTAAGALSCHEAITTEDVLSRLQQGYYVMVREGYIRHDLEIIFPVIDRIDLRRLILVTDGSEPELLIRQGYLVDVVQKAVDMGLEKIRAVQMVTLNPAEHFRIDHITGGISPGRFADILLLPESGAMKPEMVISNGKIVAEKGRASVPLQRISYPEELYNTVKIPFIFPSDMSTPVSDAGSDGEIRTLDIQPGGLVTREGKARASVRDGLYISDPEEDLLKVVFIERVSGTGEKFIGFVRGWKQKCGAVATSLCWDVSGVIAIGENDSDLATAINKVIEMKGGTAVCKRGEISVAIPFPVGGYVSEMEIECLSREMTRFQEIVSSFGVAFESALLTLYTLTSASIPFIKIMEKGYYRFREGDVVGL
ncbi:MAG TPA: adenine deaminase C-terminal domain-containing protein [Desulfobacteraceae bacterium]|nr:adenine deaminase C-terminal domain-containing protein [Desulfobacteraceae bacterium]HPJ66295.1 adenine deaminase C-terminal domain-containing protein [Desulfobacteraceae bacterium]HPQ29796.1 adenine deaminase C-terminal domain-containing protein [Desulfobacteraceae bacterium]